MGVLIPPAERRAARRMPIHLLPNLGTVRVSSEEVIVVNASSSGLLVESPRRLRPGTENAVEILRAEAPVRVRGRIVRCEVKALSPDGPRYQIAIAFVTPVDLLVDTQIGPELLAAFGIDALVLGDPDPELALNNW